MKKNILYFLVFIICIVAAFYYLRYPKAIRRESIPVKNTIVNNPFPGTKSQLVESSISSATEDWLKKEKEILGYNISLDGVQWTRSNLAFFIEDLTGADCSLRSYVRCESNFCMGEWESSKEPTQLCVAAKNSCMDREPDPSFLLAGEYFFKLHLKNPSQAQEELKKYIVNNFVSRCDSELDKDLLTVCEVPREEFCSKHKAKVLSVTSTGTAFCEVPSSECVYPN